MVIVETGTLLTIYFSFNAPLIAFVYLFYLRKIIFSG